MSEAESDYGWSEARDRVYSDKSKCKYCGGEIRWQQIPRKGWVAFDGHKKHTCRQASASDDDFDNEAGRE